MVNEVELVILGVVVGGVLSFVSGVILPLIQSCLNDRREKSRFEKQLKLEISNLRKSIEGEINSLFSEINPSNLTDYIFKIDSKASIIPRSFHTKVFDSKFELFILLDEKIQEQVNTFYVGVSTLNSISSTYKKIPSDNEGTKNDLLIIYSIGNYTRIT